MLVKQGGMGVLDKAPWYGVLVKHDLALITVMLQGSNSSYGKGAPADIQAGWMDERMKGSRE